MAVRIKFDSNHNAIEPTMVLAMKNGDFLGTLQSSNIKFKDNLNSYSEFSFDVYKSDYITNLALWNKIDNFKIVWVKDWNRCYEIYVELFDEGSIRKNITAKSLGEAELSQINLYGIEINTEDDIARDDYTPTVLYNSENHSASLLHRISEKIPHYTIAYVDDSIKNIQRTFKFDNKSIYDCLQEVAEEIHCLFKFECGYVNGSLVRKISVYDLEDNCNVCHERDNFLSTCTKCGSSNITKGYGNDTGILIDTENLADNINYQVENESVKNCFKLETGDDLMTATVINSNPNGSGYIWYISDKMKQDMSTALVTKLNNYDTTYNQYMNNFQSTILQDTITRYNALITKYSSYTSDYPQLTYPLVGFSQIMEADYNVIDFYLFLKDGLMPSIVTANTNANSEIAKLTVANLSPVSVQDLSLCTQSTAESAVLSVAKTLIDSRYKVDITTVGYSSNTWQGSFTVTNYSDETDTATTSNIIVTVDGDYGNFVKQRIDKLLARTVANGEPTDITSLFALSNTDFENAIKGYCLTRLNNFHDCCQSCLDILTQQGIADKTLWNSQNGNLYNIMYLPYYQKLHLLEAEIQDRQNDLEFIAGKYDLDGKLQHWGIQTLIEDNRKFIQKTLNFKDFLGEQLWLEFSTFRREDVYKNDNYISDGLNNAELFKMAEQFLNKAKREIIKSATMQHKITAMLKNLLVMPEFSPILNQFEVGNWIRIRVDGELYKLRLLSYEIDFNNLNNLSVEFSDVVTINDIISDVQSIIKQAQSISSSYSGVTRQADKGSKASEVVNSWKNNGLDVSNTKLICQADNQTYSSDEHGVTFKKRDPLTDIEDTRQLKITNSTIAITDDNWETVKSAVGFYYYYDTTEQKLKEVFGVNGETIVGKLLLGEKLKIQNDSGNMTFDDNGFSVANSKNAFTVNPNSNQLLSLSRIVNGNSSDMLYVDNDGVLHLIGRRAEIDLSDGFGIFSDENDNREMLLRINQQGLRFFDYIDNPDTSAAQTRLRKQIFYAGRSGVLLNRRYTENTLVKLGEGTLTFNGRSVTFNNGAGIASQNNEIFAIGTSATLGSIDSNNGTNLYWVKALSTGIECHGNFDMGSYSIQNNSDISLKTNIADTNVNALDLLNRIEMKSFDWIENGNHQDIGIIAQQLQNVLPNLITENADNKLSIKPIEFIPYLIKAVQELSRQIRSN